MKEALENPGGIKDKVHELTHGEDKVEKASSEQKPKDDGWREKVCPDLEAQI